MSVCVVPRMLYCFGPLMIVRIEMVDGSFSDDDFIIWHQLLDWLQGSK